MWATLCWHCPPILLFPSVSPFKNVCAILACEWKGLRTEWWGAVISPPRGHFREMLLFSCHVFFFPLALQMSVALSGPLEEDVYASNLSTLLNKKANTRWTLLYHFRLSPAEERGPFDPGI